MKGIAIEHRTSAHTQEVINWLKDFGPSSPDLWFEDYDYDLVTLVMTEDLYLMYKLKWI